MNRTQRYNLTHLVTTTILAVVVLGCVCFGTYLVFGSEYPGSGFGYPVFGIEYLGLAIALTSRTGQSNKIQHFTDLTAWQEAHRLVLAVYQCTRGFPAEERYGLVSQIRRAAISITSNIAEGFGRTSTTACPETSFRPEPVSFWPATLRLGLKISRYSSPSDLCLGYKIKLFDSKAGFRTCSTEKQQFYSIALGSTAEVESQIYAARDLSFLTPTVAENLRNQTTSVSKLPSGLSRSAGTRSSPIPHTNT